MKRLIALLMFVALPAMAACPVPDGSSPSCALNVTGTTSGTTAVASQTAFPTASISNANTYQQLAAAGSCTHGGLFVATQTASSTGVEYVDETSGVTSGGTTLSNGAIPLGGSQSTNQPGQSIMISPTPNAVFVYGPAGATFRGWCS